MLRSNNFWVGFILGGILPILTAAFFIIVENLVVFTDPTSTLYFLTINKNIIFILVCSLNLPIMKYYTRIGSDEMARGIAGISVICALIFIIYKLWTE